MGGALSFVMYGQIGTIIQVAGYDAVNEMILFRQSVRRKVSAVYPAGQV
jgi:hypothetical protein